MRLALVLMGGGARAAYQAGALKALGEIMREAEPERRTSAYLGQFVKDELVKWGKAMRASGVIAK